MTEKVRQVIEEIESGQREAMHNLNFSLEEYLSKDTEGISFLEYLLKKDIYVSETEVFENSLEAAQIYLKLGKNLWNFNLDEKNLFTDIGGKRFIDLLITKNELSNKFIKNIKNNIEIVDILISNNKLFNLYSLSNEIVDKLMTQSQDGIYIIEKYFNKDDIIKNIIPLIKRPKELIELCKKYNKNDLLKEASVEVLMYKIDKNKTLLEDLYSKNIEPTKLKKIPENINFVNFLREKNFYNYLKDADESVLLLNIEKEKTLLEELIEKNKITKINKSVYDKKIINILYKKNKLDLIVKTNSTVLLSPVNKIINDIEKEETFLEYMLDQGHNPLLEDTFFLIDKEIIKIYCNKSYYNFLGEKRLEDETLLIELKDGITLIDKLLETNVNINFQYGGFKSDVIAKKIFDKQRFDLLIKADFNLLFNNIVSEHTYLDYILEGIKTKKINYNLNKLLYSNTSNNSLAKFYLTLAKKDMMEYIDDLREEDLLKEYDGKRLLDELLDQDKDLTLNKVLSSKVKSNAKIAIILKSKGFEQKNIDIDLENKEFDKTYLNIIENSHGIGPLLNEGEYLLAKLYELFINDGKSDLKLISALVSGYRQALFVNYELNIQELRNLVEVKEKNMEKFIYEKHEDNSFFRPSTGAVYCEKIIINTLLHETGHALHYYLGEKSVPKEYKEAIKRVRDNPETLKKVEKYADEYNSLKEKIKEIAEKKHQDFFESYFNEEKIKEIEEFIKKAKEGKKETFKSLGLPDEVLDVIINNTFTVEEYFEQQKRIIINEFFDDIIRSEFGSFMAIGDIIDAIYLGELKSGTLTNNNGEKIKRTAGHGISYYSNDDHGFDEMIANFSSIIKSNESQKILNLLKDIVGEELFNMLSEFYFNNIIISKNENLEQGRSL